MAAGRGAAPVGLRGCRAPACRRSTRPPAHALRSRSVARDPPNRAWECREAGPEYRAHSLEHLPGDACPRGSRRTLVVILIEAAMKQLEREIVGESHGHGRDVSERVT